MTDSRSWTNSSIAATPPHAGAGGASSTSAVTTAKATRTTPSPSRRSGSSTSSPIAGGQELRSSSSTRQELRDPQQDYAISPPTPSFSSTSTHVYKDDYRDEQGRGGQNHQRMPAAPWSPLEEEQSRKLTPPDQRQEHLLSSSNGNGSLHTKTKSYPKNQNGSTKSTRNEQDASTSSTTYRFGSHTTSSAIPFGQIDESLVPRLQAEVHEFGQQFFDSIDIDRDVTFRALSLPDDMDECRRLHTEWFPIAYDDSFYRSIAQGHIYTLGAYCGNNLLGLICVSLACTHHAEILPTVLGQRCSCSDICHQSDVVYAPKKQNPNHNRQRARSCDDLGETYDMYGLPTGDGSTLAAGGQILTTSSKPNNFQNYNHINGSSSSRPSRSRNRHVDYDYDRPLPSGAIAYILTLGVIDEMRRRGLGRRLLLEIIHQLPSFKYQSLCVHSPRALALHVIPYNKAALRLYEGMGFIRLDEVQDFYILHGVRYAAYVYAFYLGDNKRPPGAGVFSRALGSVKSFFVTMWDTFFGTDY
ncbi:unnamed protein product [Amoebophrya sp. A25]|nr:unnamed protein product [Amoebophrya sp. A25]|eukprot:GSA25T00006978001.1